MRPTFSSTASPVCPTPPCELLDAPTGEETDHLLLCVPCTVSGSLFDFGLYIFHNGRALLSRGSGPYFYLPKMESHLEARLWADAFRYAEQRLNIPHGSIKATVLIGTSGPPSPLKPRARLTSDYITIKNNNIM